MRTEPFMLTGARLFVNVDASGGELCVEVLDAGGQVTASSALIDGDRPSAKVEWEQGNVAELLSKEVSLRFTLRNARLYSYWVATTDDGHERGRHPKK